MEESMFDPYYLADVLSDLLSRQRGSKVTIKLTPKEESMEVPVESHGG